MIGGVLAYPLHKGDGLNRRYCPEKYHWRDVSFSSTFAMWEPSTALNVNPHMSKELLCPWISQACHFSLNFLLDVSFMVAVIIGELISDCTLAKNFSI